MAYKYCVDDIYIEVTIMPRDILAVFGDNVERRSERRAQVGVHYVKSRTEERT